MTSKTRVGVAIAVLAGVAWACDDWSLWDDMFKRSSVASAPRGWTGGDGAISAALPNNRVFWAFGDSYLTSWDANARRPELRNPTDFGMLNDVVFGNTLAVQDNRADPNPAGIRFYARPAPGYVDVHGSLFLFAPEEITAGRSESSGYSQFFSHVMLHLSLPDPNGPPTVLWPSSAECLDCATPASARLLVGFTEIQLCDPTIHSPCEKFCDLLQISENPCRHGFNVASSVIARIKGIDQAPSAWSFDSTTGAPRALRLPGGPVQWGKAFVEESGFIYIYGVRSVNLALGTNELVLARAPKAEVLLPSSWRFLDPSNAWVTSSSSLKIVASSVGAMVSVDAITPTGKPKQYVLAHGDLTHQLYVRTSSSLTGWDPPGLTTPRLDLVSIDSTLGWQILDMQARGELGCNVRSAAGVQDYRGCGLVYHGLGHHHLSQADGTRLLTSYIVPYGPNPWFDRVAGESPSNPATGGQDARYYRPKFVNLDLSKIKPWCSTDCWEGLVKQWPQRALGSTSLSYDFDISQANRFYAQLTRMSGSALMRVDQSATVGSPLLRTDNCPAVNGVLTCNVPKYVNGSLSAGVARVVVSGVASDTYGLRTHYAGAF